MNSNSTRPGQLDIANIDSLSVNEIFDVLGRSSQDMICVSPVRTIIRREEEIVLIRRIRKVEEIDASPACPINTTQISGVSSEGSTSY
jgi:hypothetical protein